MAVPFNPATDYPIAYCRNEAECRFYLQHLLQAQRLESGKAGSWTVTLPGWQYLEGKDLVFGTSTQAFVAMWFDKSIQGVFTDGIKPLEAETGYTMLRIDMTQFNDKICDQILREIRRCTFLIADVTGHRQGVYFEAGFAMGLGKPVIWTCKKDEIGDAHFDTRQYNHITWETPSDLQQKLRDRILATIGPPVARHVAG